MAAATETPSPRLQPVRRRVALAKAGFVVGAALVFGAAMAFSRAHHPSKPKPHLHPLSAPGSFVSEVRGQHLDPGQIEPAVEPPSSATGLS